MSAKRGLRLSLVLALALCAVVGAQTPPAAQCVPPDALMYVQVSQPKVLLDLLAGKQMTEAITSLPLYRQQLSNPKFTEFVAIVRYLETTLGTDWRSALAQLAGGGVALAVCPQDTVVLIVDANDERMLEQLHTIFLGFSRGEAEKQGHPERVASKEYRGATAWTFDGKEAHAIVGRRLLFSSRFEGLKAVLDLQAEQGKSMADNQAFQAAMRSSSPTAAAVMFMNLKPLLGLPKLAQLLDSPRENPLAALVFSGISESFRNSTWLALGLDVADKTLAARIVTDGKAGGPESAAAFALPQKAADGAWPNLSVPRRIAAMSLYRDLHGFYAAKDSLFPERTSGLIFFENMMGIFFTGRDLTSEVLAETQPEVRIVVARQQYDPEVGTPAIQLPAFAAVLRMRHPEPFGEVVEEAWQKAVGLINFTRGQQALPGLIIDRPAYKETKYTVAYFSSADVEDKTKLDTRFNARPALAMCGEYLILSSTDGLARDLLDALGDTKGPAVTPVARTHSLLEIDGATAAEALQANRETLVRGDMVKKGKSRQEAEAGIDMLITVVKFIDRVKLSIGTREDLTEMQLQVLLGGS